MGTEKLPDLIDLAHQLSQTFERQGIAYFIGGSVASSLMGEYRFTNDIDIVIELQSDQLTKLLKAFGDDYYYGLETAQKAVESGGSFNLIHIPTAQKIDLFVSKKTSFEKEQFNRRKPLKVRDGIQLFVATPEDVLLSKMRWFRMGGEVSDHQWRDILGLLKVQSGLLDRTYLQKWASVLGVTDLLEKSLSEV